MSFFGGWIMKYLTVGRDELTTVRKVEDTETIKPRGGLWLTKYENEHYNEWVDYILEDTVALVYKSRGSSIWKQPCSLVTLKESANIFTLNDADSLSFLKDRYPQVDNKFSYSELSKDYDGIYVDMYKLLMKVDDSRFYKFGVNSLILFNFDCIDYYQSGMVDIEPFDYEYGYCETVNYEIKCNDAKKRILRR